MRHGQAARKECKARRGFPYYCHSEGQCDWKNATPQGLLNFQARQGLEERSNMEQIQGATMTRPDQGPKPELCSEGGLNLSVNSTLQQAGHGTRHRKQGCAGSFATTYCIVPGLRHTRTGMCGKVENSTFLSERGLGSEVARSCH